jgi:solute carrier family 25 (mitochondrial citrate transporter), member 1
VVTPGENVKTKLVEAAASGNQQFKSSTQVIRHIAQVDGPLGFFRGIVPVTMKQGSNAFVRFTSYSSILSWIQPQFERVGCQGWSTAVAGAAAGIITAYATMPFDVIKTKMQAYGEGNAHKGTVQCLVTILRTSNIKGLWKGTTPRLMRLSVSTFSPGLLQHNTRSNFILRYRVPLVSVYTPRQ